MDTYWPQKRQVESMGFVSKRIIPFLICRQMLLFGNSFVRNFGKINQIINPWDVVIIDGEPRCKN